MYRLALFDTETDYTQRLASRLGARKDPLFDIHAFTRRDALFRYLSDAHPQILLVAAKDYSDDLAPEGCTLLLLDDGTPADPRIPSVSKYQSAEELSRRILLLLPGGIASVPGAVRKTGLLIGVHSPLHRCGKTLFALALADRLGQNASVLFLSFDADSYLLRSFMPPGKEEADCPTLSDLLFYVHREESSFDGKLDAAALPFGNARILLPAPLAQDIEEADPAEVRTLLDALRTRGRFDAVVADFGSALRGIPDLLSSCDRLFRPELPDPLSGETLRRYAADPANAEAIAQGRPILVPPLPPDPGSADAILRGLPLSPIGSLAAAIIREEAFL